MPPSGVVTSALRRPPAGSRSKRWYSPPGCAKRARSARPQRSSSTRQPAARNISASWRGRASAVTRSRLWRFTSTTQSTLPSLRTTSSPSISQTLPSSSSASPTITTKRAGAAAPP